MPSYSFLTPALFAFAVSAIPLNAQLLVTEIHSDGLWDFWELTNVGTATVDLSGYKWDDDSRNANDAAAVTIPNGTTIAAGESIVFAGVAVGNATTFRTAWNIPTTVQVIVGGPNFGGGDGVAFFNPSNVEQFFFSYAAYNSTTGIGFTRTNGDPSSGGHAGLSAGGTATQALIWDTGSTTSPRYTNATGGNFGSFPAGTSTTVFGSPGYSGFGGAPPSITLSVSATPASFAESAANPAASGTVTRTGAATNALVVNLSSSDPTEATVPASVTIPNGSASANFAITAVDDSFPDGVKTATITVSAADATPGTVSLTVTDDGDTLDTSFILTEIQSNQSAGKPTGAEDYWELTNVSGSTKDISGYSWHDNGRSGAAASAYKLPPGTSIAAGEQVIFTAMPAADFRAWWNLSPSVQVFQSTGAPGLGKGDGISFFDAGQNELFFFSYAIGGFTMENGSPSVGESASAAGHAGIAAGGSVDSQALVWVPTSGSVSPRYTFANGTNYGSRSAVSPATDLGSPGSTSGGATASTVSIGSASMVEGNSGNSTLALNVTRTDTATAFTLVYAVTGGTADGSDYTLVSGTLTFAAGGPATLPVSISVHGDTVLEEDEAVVVTLSNVVNTTGSEGLSWDPPASNFIVLKEKSPIGVFLAGVDFTAGTTTTAPPVIGNEASNLFNTGLLGMSDVADVFAFSNLPAMAGQPQEANLLILGQEDARVVNINRSGVIASTLNLNADPGDTISSPNMQHEGITMDRAGNIYIVNENGGGDINYPQLWVYAPSTAENTAPTAVALNNTVSSLQENTSTTSPLKLGDIVVIDDGLGTNQLALSGVDAASFEITGGELYLKAGVTLDFESKTSYAVTISVDDTTLGGTPDASVNFTLTVTDQVVETPSVPALLITEVSPWSSGNSPVAADWFEVSNVSDNAVTITGWKVDDGSAAFASALDLDGITTIAPGESVIFVEGSATTADSFKTNWFGASPPSGLQVGYYSGSGIGLSTSGDGVNLFNAGGALQASVSFGTADATSPYQTFDNTVALNNSSISQLSVAGVNGAFVAANSAVEIGSPGYSAPPVLRVTEVAPWSSGNSPLAADWFEVTNSGSRAASITGWKVDDSSESPAAALALNGITSIAPGESVIFIETADLPGKSAAFRTLWFGANPPSALQFGSYSGAGIGLSTGGDAVNLYDTSSPTPVRRVNLSFGTAPSVAPFATYDNTAAVNVGAVTLKSVPGVNGAFIAANDTNEVGSPGSSTGGGPLDFALWLSAKGYTSRGLGTDSDSDGLTDGVEFFFNQNPNNGVGFANMPQLVPNAGAMELDFTRLTNTGGVTGELLISGDLTIWTEAQPGLDYTVASSIITGDETAFTLALPGTGPSASGTSATYLNPNTSDPVGASLGGVRVVNEGLVGVGRLSGESVDKFGETQGAASGLFITDWSYNAGLFSGTFQVLPDRGYGDGSSNYAARLHEVDFTFTPYYGSTATTQGQVQPTYADSTKFTYQDGATVKFTTGLNPTGTSTLFGQTVGTVTAANGPGGSQESLLSMDAEAVYLFDDGSGYISDEYGTYIARFDATKRITGITQLPGAAQPFRPAGTPNFDSVTAPTTGRRNNQGFEGMSVTPDGTRMFALLQSALVQDTNGSQQQTRNNARLFVYDIVGANRENPVLVGEYVVKLPQIDLDPNTAPSALNGTAAQSEIVALGNSSFLMLPRDGNGLGKLNSAAITFKSVQLVEFASATNILGQYDGVGQKIIGTDGLLLPEIHAAATAEVINMLHKDDLDRFGLNKDIPANTDTLNEKIEGMALVPDLSTPVANDFFLFIANDNDFQSSNVMMLDAGGNVTSKGNGQVGGITNDAMFYAYRITIDAGGKKFFRFEIK